MQNVWAPSAETVTKARAIRLLPSLSRSIAETSSGSSMASLRGSLNRRGLELNAT